MNNATENNNGRFFEYLVTQHLEDNFEVKLTENAKLDQERDSEKEFHINLKTKQLMQDAIPKISSWLESKIVLDKETIVDRMKDHSESGTHDDILISRDDVSIGFSLKHNHDSIFHGRTFTIFNWCGFDKNSTQARNFLETTDILNRELKNKIEPGVKFSVNRLILDEYQGIWSAYVRDIFNELSSFININCNNPTQTEKLFNKIIGHGGNSFRVLKKSSSRQIIIQDLRSLTTPHSVTASIKQKDGWSDWVWFLVLEFSNGMIIEARSKQDDTMLYQNRLPPLKPDWKVTSWGESGMIEETF
tara:strand:- start:1100 stop:2008 length:909 start_codon:yes stop_codon:yes gene_type:complete